MMRSTTRCAPCFRLNAHPFATSDNMVEEFLLMAYRLTAGGMQYERTLYIDS